LKPNNGARPPGCAPQENWADCQEREKYQIIERGEGQLKGKGNGDEWLGVNQGVLGGTWETTRFGDFGVLIKGRGKKKKGKSKQTRGKEQRNELAIDRELN